VLGQGPPLQMISFNDQVSIWKGQIYFEHVVKDLSFTRWINFSRLSLRSRISYLVLAKDLRRISFERQNQGQIWHSKFVLLDQLFRFLLIGENFYPHMWSCWRSTNSVLTIDYGSCFCRCNFVCRRRFCALMVTPRDHKDDKFAVTAVLRLRLLWR
jgi:hypothetical protein